MVFDIVDVDVDFWHSVTGVFVRQVCMLCAVMPN